MDIFWRLVLGHFLADFTFQSDYIAAWKRRNLAGMLAHCGMHPVAYAALTYPFLGLNWVQTSWLALPGWACILIIFALHFAEDQWRISSIFRGQAPDNTLYFAWDQGFHYASIFIFLPIGLADMSQGWFPERWTILALLFVVVTHFGTVLIYFLEKDLFAASFPEFDEKYLAMAARLALALCFMLPGGLWVLAFAWAAVVAYMRRERVIELSWFSLGLGAAIAVVGGVAGRCVYY